MDYRREGGDRSRRGNDDFYSSRRRHGRSGPRSRGDSRRRRHDDSEDDYYDERPPRPHTGSRKRPPQGDDSFERSNSPLPDWNDRHDRHDRGGGWDRDRDRDRDDDWQNSGYGRDRDSANGSEGRGSRGRFDQSQRGMSRSRKGKVQHHQDRFEDLKGRPRRENSKKTNAYREVCAALQKTGGNMQATRRRLFNFQDKDTGTIQARNFYREIGDILGDLATPEMEHLIRKSGSDFSEGGGFLSYEPLFARFILEMEKLELQQRLFIQLRKKMTKHKCSFQAVLQKYEAIESRDEAVMSGFSFCEMLEKFGVLSCFERDKEQLNLMELRPIFDEYTLSDDENDDKNDSNENPHNSSKDQQNQPINSSESARGGVATPAEEVNRRTEEAKFKKAKFSVSEVEQDFKDFERVILPEVETAVMMEIAKYCTIQDFNLVKVFFPTVEGGRRSGRDSKRSRGSSQNPMGIAVQPFVHVQDMFRIQNNVEIEANYADKRNRQYKSLFAVFISRLATPKKLIPFDYLYRLASKPEVQDIQNLCDRSTDKLLVSYYRTKLLKAVSEIIHLDSKRRSPEELLALQTGRTTSRELLDRLRESPFEIRSRLEDICVLAALGKYFPQNGQERLSERDLKEDFLIDSAKFLEEVRQGMAEYHTKDEVALKLSQALFERGITVETLVSNVLGIKNAADFELTEDDLSTCLSIVKAKVPPEHVTSFIRVLSNNFDEKSLAVERLITEVKGFDRPKQQLDQGQQQTKAAKHLSKKIRKYRSVAQVLEHIGTKIEDFNLRDIGPLLKGQDYEDNGLILRGNFYQTLMSFGEFFEGSGMMQGDLLDLMNELDPEGTGLIELAKFKYEVDAHIGPSDLKINLTSRVKDIVNETIVDKQKRAAGGETAPREVQKPSHFYSFALDLFCGLEMAQTTVQEHFSSFSQSGTGINQREFWGGVEALKVKVEKKAAVFKYILASQMNKLQAGGGSTGRSHGDTSRREEEVSLLIGTLAKHELLEVDCLKEVLEDDVPFYDDQERLVQSILTQMLPVLSSKKVPILDAIDPFRLTDNKEELPDDFDANNVSRDHFRAKILGPQLHLQVSPNQGALLSQVYRDEEYEEYIQIDRFIHDLKALAEKPSLVSGKPTELFMTKADVDHSVQEKLKLNLGDPEFAGSKLESDPAERKGGRSHDPELEAKYLGLFCQQLRGQLEAVAQEGIRFKDIRYSEIAELMRTSLRISLDNDSSVQTFMNRYELWREKNLVGRAFTDFCRGLNIVQNFDQATLLALFHQKAPSERVKLQRRQAGHGRYSSLQSETLSSIPHESSLANDRFGSKTYSHGRKAVDISQWDKTLDRKVPMRELLALDGELFIQKFRQGEVTEEERSNVINWVLYNDFSEIADPNVKSKAQFDPLQPKFVISTAGKVDMDNENPFKFEIPEKFLKFYRSLEERIQKHNQMYEFCDLLVGADKQKVGFLSNPAIHKCFKRIEVDLTKKEVAMITYILHRGDDETFSYPEMIGHMFGKQNWYNVQLKHSLAGPGFDIDFGGKGKQAEVKHIIISKKLQLRIEFFYSELLAVQDELSQGTDLLSEDEFILLFTRVGIGLSQSDKEALKNFHSSHCQVGRGQMSIKELYGFYRMSDRLHSSRELIKKFFQQEEKQVEANILLRAKMYIFEDFINFLKKSGFDLRLVSKTYKKQASGDYSTAMKKDVHPDDYDSEYPDLLDIYKVGKDNQTMLSRRAIMDLFAIPVLDVSREIEERRLKKEGPRSSSRALKKGDSKQTIVHDDERKQSTKVVPKPKKLGPGSVSRRSSEASRSQKDRPKDAIPFDAKEAFALVKEHLKKYRDSAKLKELEKQTTIDRLKALVAELKVRGLATMPVAEFCTVLFSNPDKKIMANIDRDTQSRLDQQIDRLFRQVDANHNDFVDIDELYQLLKPLRPGKVTKAECEKIIKEYDINNDGQLDRDEFYQVVKHELAHYLTRKADDLENYRIMFRLADRDMDGQLSKHEFLQVVGAHIVEDYDEYDMQKLIQFLDPDRSGKISIDEFFVLLQNSGHLNFQIPGQLENSEKNEHNRAVQRSLLEIRQGVGLDLFDFFAFCRDSALPSFFEPSFLQPLLEKEQKHHASQNLLKARDYILDPVPADLFSNAEQLALLKLKENFFEISISDIENVPVPKLSDSSTSFKLEDVQQRELRVILRDSRANQFISNAYILPASGSPDGKKWSFDFLQCVDFARTVCFKAEPKSRDAEVLFELVLTMKQKTKQGEHYQLTNGWGSIPVATLLKHSDARVHRVVLKGGSPNNSEEVDLSQVQEKAQAQQRGFRMFKKNVEEEDDRKMGKAFFLKLKVSQVVESDLTSLQHMLYASLPMDHLFNKHLMTFISALNFHKLRLAANANSLPDEGDDDQDDQDGEPEKDQDRAPEALRLPENDFLITCAQRALCSTDLNLLLASAWHSRYCPLSAGEGFKDMGITKQVSELEKQMKLLVSEVYEKLMNNQDAFKVDRVYPTRPDPANERLLSQVPDLDKIPAKQQVTAAFNMVEMMGGGSSSENSGMADMDHLIRKHAGSIKRISNPGFDIAKLKQQ